MSSKNVVSTIEWDTSELERFFSLTFPNLVEEASQTAGKKASQQGLERFRLHVRVDTGSAKKSGRTWSKPSSPGLLWEGGIRFGGYVVNPKTGRVVDYAVYLEKYQKLHDQGGPIELGTIYAANMMPIFLAAEIKKRLSQIRSKW